MLQCCWHIIKFINSIIKGNAFGYILPWIKTLPTGSMFNYSHDGSGKEEEKYWLDGIVEKK